MDFQAIKTHDLIIFQYLDFFDYYINKGLINHLLENYIRIILIFLIIIFIIFLIIIFMISIIKFYYNSLKNLVQ